MIKLSKDLFKYIISWLRVPIALISTQYSLMIEYRAEIILWAISGILPLIMLAIWKEATISERIGLSDDYLTRYFVSAFIVRQFTAVWVMVSFEEDNLEGRLSPYLLQPLMPFWRYFSSHIAEQISRIPIVLIMLLVLNASIPNILWIPSLKTLVIFCCALFSAFCVRFLLHWMFSMICFWSDRVSALERLLLIPYLFLSGLVAPLDTFPTPIRNFANLTPFPYILAFPSNILAEKKIDLISNFTSLFFWAILLFLLSYLFWKRGIRHYSGMGA